MYGVSRSVDPGGFADCLDPGGPPLHCTAHHWWVCPTVTPDTTTPLHSHCDSCETFKLNRHGFLWSLSRKRYQATHTPNTTPAQFNQKYGKYRLYKISAQIYSYFGQGMVKNRSGKISLAYIKGMKICVSKLVGCKMPVCAKLALNTRSANVLFMLILMTE